MPSDAPTIARIEARKCVLPLARPFTLGHSLITHREYVIVDVTDTDGVTGSSFALARGGPTDVVVGEMVGPRYIGRNSADPAALAREIGRGLQPQAVEGILGRAMSLVDIALWDLKGQRAGVPVWELLGARRATAPAMIVEGYPLDGESAIAFADRLARRADEGYEYLKIAFGAVDPDGFTAKLGLVMDSLPTATKVSVDAAWTWYEPTFARKMLDAWTQFDLAWIEDPVAADDIPALAEMKAHAGIRLGVGDEVARPQTLIDAARSGAIDVLRIDTTCAGGYSRFPEIAAAAEADGLMVSTHVYPELNIHSALGATARGPVELFPPFSPWDVTAEFVEPVTPVKRDGRMVFEAPTAPGLGHVFDHRRIDEATVRTTVAGERSRVSSRKASV